MDMVLDGFWLFPQIKMTLKSESFKLIQETATAV